MRTAFLTLLVVITISCSTENENPVIKSIVPTRYVEDNYTRELKYDAANRITQMVITTTYPNNVVLTSTQNFSYNDAGKISMLTTDGDMKFVYHYENSLLTGTDEFIGDHITQTHTFTYDAKHRVSEHKTYQDIPEEGGVIPVAKSTFAYDANGNVLQYKQYYYSTGGTNEALLSTLDYNNYDSKINIQVHFEMNAVNPYLVQHANNPGKLVIKNGNGVLSSVTEFAYDYNSFDYPTAKHTTVTENSKTTTTHGQYFYN